ncbi:MAG TPA: EAL domain-containing protein [Acidobacteriota bacterium]|nr:EAL domain-containing protein [Acidobacteriota bacterium]
MTQHRDSLLVVDDDAMNRDLMCRRLTRQGYSVSSAGNGKEAIEWVYSNNPDPDLVLLDVEMPDVNGLDVLKRLRETHTQAQLPVIMVTGKACSEDIITALSAGANDYVTKPIDFPVVIARIQAQLLRKHAENALRESEERYALAASGANDGLWDWDLKSGLMYLSPRWKSMLGWEAHEISNDPDEWFSRIHPDDIERVKQDINAHLEMQTPHYEDEYRILHKEGNYLWVLGRGLAVRDSNGKASRIAGSQTDITRGKVLDVLTGLPNRVLFMDRLARLFEKTRRCNNKKFALIFLDLDSFKLINDSLGHIAGDQLLVAIAGRLEGTVRSSDSVARLGCNHTIARLGGDEFTILLEDMSSTHDAVRVAERISKELSLPFLVAGHELFPTASIGIAVYAPSYQTPEELLRDADTAMYSAKSMGKGRYEIFDVNMRASAVARLQLETELRRALERGEFENYYQAIVSLQTGKIHGFETLVRWNNGARGLISPQKFIPVAEETGLIVPLGQWVLESACKQMRMWQARFPDNPPLTISVNISSRQFLQDNLAEMCRSILHQTRLCEHSLILEVTESAMMPDPETAINLMRQIRKLGIRISLDDFGTGYSSLSYLHRFPIDTLKIDRSFISRIMDDDEIVRAILTLGKNLRLKVIAEGVETTEQAAKLRDLECEYAQGYCFSVPVNAQEATDLLLAERHSCGHLLRGSHNLLNMTPQRSGQRAGSLADIPRFSQEFP